jgi:hypothetical protein
MPRRSLTVAVTFVFMLALVPDAEAKGPVTSLRVCGAAGCASVPVPRLLKGPLGVDWLVGRVRAATTDPPPAPFYRLRAGMPGGGGFTIYYLPGGEMLRDQDWVILRPRMAAEIDAAVAGMRPIVPSLSSVRIGDRQIADPSPYAPLLRALPAAPGAVSPDVTRSVGIFLTTREPTPWGLGRVVFALYDRRTKLVSVGTSVGLAPPSVVRALGHAHTADGGDSSAIWAGGAIAVAASAGLVLAGRRRRRDGAG